MDRRAPPEAHGIPDVMAVLGFIARQGISPVHLRKCVMLTSPVISKYFVEGKMKFEDENKTQKREENCLYDHDMIIELYNHGKFYKRKHL